MWWRLDLSAGKKEVRALLGALIAGGGLDPDRVRGWTILRAVDYWLWCLPAGLTVDPIRCRRLLEALK